MPIFGANQETGILRICDDTLDHLTNPDPIFPIRVLKGITHSGSKGMQLHQNSYIPDFETIQKAGPRRAVIFLKKRSNLMNLLLCCEAPKSKENILSSN